MLMTVNLLACHDELKFLEQGPNFWNSKNSFSLTVCPFKMTITTVTNERNRYRVGKKFSGNVVSNMANCLRNFVRNFVWPIVCFLGTLSLMYIFSGNKLAINTYAKFSEN